MQRRVAQKETVNNARLDAIKSLIKRKEDSQNQIRQSLQASVDNAVKKASHVQFSDSDDDDHGTQTDMQPKKDYNDILGFNKSDGDSKNDEIKIKPQFQGKTGQELLELQSTYGNDKRFRLDERFASSEGDSEVTAGLHESGNEAAKNMEILDHVIGHKVAPASKRKVQNFIDMDTQRFDPTKGQGFETKREPKGEPPVKAKKKKKVQQDIPADSRKFYKTSTNILKDAFADKAKTESAEFSVAVNHDSSDSVTKPFSFLAMMGADENEHETAEENMDSETAITNVPVPSNERQTPTAAADSDSSSEDDEKMDFGQNQETEDDLVQKLPQNQDKKYPQTFFMTSPNDARMVDGVLEFCRKKSFEQIQKEWLEVKDTLIFDYKKKHRDAKRKAKFEERQERLRSYQT